MTNNSTEDTRSFIPIVHLSAVFQTDIRGYPAFLLITSCMSFLKHEPRVMCHDGLALQSREMRVNAANHPF